MNSSEAITKKYKKKNRFAEVVRCMSKNKAAILGLVIVVIMILTAIFADQIADYDQVAIKQDIANRLQGPSSEHWLGTDELGRDVFARIVHGTRISLYVGTISVIISIGLGGLLGAVAGYYGGKLDNLIMRILDVFLAIPAMLLAIAIVSAIGSSMFNLMLAIGISSVPQFARITRASVLSVKDEEFIESARAIGAKDSGIIWSHIIPNCMAPIIVQATLKIGKAIVFTASLSFIGLGVKAPTPEWGAMLSGSRAFIRDCPHLVLFPGLAIMLIVLALNMLGDGLRDALDPKLK